MSQKYQSILQLSDLHILQDPKQTMLGISTEHYFHACLEQAFASQAFDLILLTGDLAQQPCSESYLRILAAVKAYRTPCICLPGNHDDYPLMQQIFATDMINCRKQVFLGNWQLVCLNSQVIGKPEGWLADQELEFLESCLIKNPDFPTVIAVHHHCLPTSSSWMDTLIIANSVEFLAIVSRYPQVKAITTGHIHQVLDISTANFRVLGAPSTCFQFLPKSTKFSLTDTAPGYRLIRLYHDGRLESDISRLPKALVGLQADAQTY